MPVYSVEELTAALPGDQTLLNIARNLAQQHTGIVLTTGQATSGKLTMLMGLAHMLAQPGQEVVLLASAERARQFETFRPLPEGWHPETAAGGREGWAGALGKVDASALVVVETLDRDNAPVLWAHPHKGWVLASVETPLLGHDVSYALREMGVTHEDFLARVRCIWSQFLVPQICESCAQPVELGPGELDYLFPGSLPPARLRNAPGCAACSGRGFNGRLAASEVLLVTDVSRARVALAMNEGTALKGDPLWHLTVHDQARRLIDEGGIAVDSYRDAIRRNPLLRAQNFLEREQAHSSRLGSVFEKFVSPEVKRRLMDSRTIDSVVNGESRDITCLFCDIRGFTSRAESLAPEELFAELNRYFAEVVDCVLANEGTIDKFIGDAVMVVFGAPLAQPDQAHRALACALAIRERVAAYNAANPEKPPIAVGMGINSGVAMAGCIGTDKRMEYTVLGDAVNTAARLESRAKAGQVLVSHSTRALVGDAFVFGPARSFELKGKAADVEASELISAA
ncbi:MAG: adenylate/guanylate cyclase domain-containing protein [Ramlibacter sp.]|nr:adenylate/guanylate cyclase domain-containing protein [Ramlibacter sp.]